jgi:plastocyanin
VTDYRAAMRRLSGARITLAFGVLLLGRALVACTDDSGNGAGNPGHGGSAGGGLPGGAGGANAGAGGASAGAGGGSAFTAVAPCDTAAAYTTGTSAATITFGATGDIAYMPRCLKVPTGAQVTFMGDFAAHPLEPSALRGTLTGNPITPTSTGTTKVFAFPSPGYYAYFCAFHGPSDGATGMVGVIWVQ